MTDTAEKYEAVVVGCGPGGAAAAATLARNGVETLVLERGVDAGSKNVSGGLIYAEESAPYTIDGLFPDFREAAAERPVTEYRIHNIAGDRVESFDIGDLHNTTRRGPTRSSGGRWTRGSPASTSGPARPAAAS